MNKITKKFPDPLEKPTSLATRLLQFIVFMIVGTALTYVYFGSIYFPPTLRGFIAWFITPLLAALVTAYIFRIYKTWYQ